MSQETYTATQAANVLGVSTKRIRQLVEEGNLIALAGVKPLAIRAESVHRELARRQKSKPESLPQSLDIAALLAAEREAVAQLFTRQLEAAEADRLRALDEMRGRLAESEASREADRERLLTLTAEAAALRQQVENLQTKRNGWWRR